MKCDVITVVSLTANQTRDCGRSFVRVGRDEPGARRWLRVRTVLSQRGHTVYEHAQHTPRETQLPADEGAGGRAQ